MATWETARARLSTVGIPLRGLQAACAQVPVRWNGIRVIDRLFIQGMREQGIQTHVWTVNDETEMQRLLEMGVDGIMTDRPALLKQVLMARGQWS